MTHEDTMKTSETSATTRPDDAATELRGRLTRLYEEAQAVYERRELGSNISWHRNWEMVYGAQVAAELGMLEQLVSELYVIVRANG